MNVRILKHCIALIAVLGYAHSFADPLPDWVSSYSADGNCYCTPEIHPSLRNKIVATPIGGQSISQVCARIGAGPGLELVDGEFNYPAYHDAQCGNGPAGVDHDGCEGRMQDDDIVCTGSGPEWDLKASYSKRAKAAPVQAEPATAAEDTSVSQDTQLSDEAQAAADAADAARARELAAQARIRAEEANAEAEANRARELARRAAERARAEAGNEASQTAEIPLESTQGNEQSAAQPASQADAEELADAKRARELAEQARLRSEQAAARQQAELQLAEQAKRQRAREQASELARQQRENEAATVVENPVAQNPVEQNPVELNPGDRGPIAVEADAAEAELARKLAQEALAKQQRQSEAELAKARAAQARAALSEVAKPEPELSEADARAERIRAAAAEAARIRTQAAAEQAEKERLESAKAESIQQVDPATEPLAESASGSAIRVPAAARGDAVQSGFIEVAPISYDFGGAGASLAGALQIRPAWHFTGRAAVAQEYSEVMAGFRRSFAPLALSGGEVNIIAGLEYGNFDLDITELTDSGVLLASSIGYNLSGRANLTAGISYSSFFEGDATVFGQFLYRLVNNLDFSSRLEGGDNDNISLGLRYHY